MSKIKPWQGIFIGFFIGALVIASFWFISDKKGVIKEDDRKEDVRKVLIGFYNAAIYDDREVLCNYLDPRVIKEMKKSIPKKTDLNLCDVFGESVEKSLKLASEQGSPEPKIDLSEISIKGDKARVIRYLSDDDYYSFRLRFDKKEGWVIVPK